MATSGSTNYTQTRDEIIADSFSLLGIYSPGDTISPADNAFASNILNKMIKGWEMKGIHLWTLQEGAVFLSNDKQSYSLSSSATDIAGNDPVFTELTADCSSTAVTVTSTAGMNVSDNIGITLDDDTVHWTTIAAIGSSTSITLTTGVASVASSGTPVFVFTNRIDRPLDITSARIRYSSGVDRPVTIAGRAEFMNLPNKTSPGPVNHIHYSPKVSTATLYTWPVCADPRDCLKISYIRRIEDFDAAGDNPDLPQECLEVITNNLSLKMAPAYGINVQKLDPDLIVSAREGLADLQMWDSDHGSTRIVPTERYDD